MGIIQFKIKPKKGRFYFNVMVFDTKIEMQHTHINYQHEVLGIQYEQIDTRKFGALVTPYTIVKVDKNGNESMKSAIGDVMFAKTQLGAGTIAHEMGHCALWYDRIINGNETATYGNEVGEEEERMLYILAELVADCINKMYQKGIL